MCDQQRLRPACAYAQTDQSLCLSLEYSMNVKLLNEHHLEFLSLKGDCTASSETTLAKMPHCWKSNVTAHFCFVFSSNMTSVFHSFPPAPGPGYVTVGEQDGELSSVPSGKAKTKVWFLSGEVLDCIDS